MPLLSITTNREIDESEAEEITRQASHTLAEMLGKPERYVMVAFNRPLAMSFAGDDAPLAYLELKTIGLPQERTGEFSKGLCNLISQQLQIPVDRVYIEFSDAQRHLWGWNQGTF